jgi:pectate lyase
MHSLSHHLTGSIRAATHAALFVFTGAVSLMAGPATPQAPTGTAVVRHAPNLAGRVDGSVQLLTGENVTLRDHGTRVSGDLLVPGTPAVLQNGHGRLRYGGTIEGTGDVAPSNYQVELGSGISLRHVIRRTDPVAMPVVAAPALPTGTRSVTLRHRGQSAGDFATLSDLTLQDDVGQVAVPAGTYGNFTANDDSSFVLGVAGATRPSVYNFQKLTLNGGSRLRVVGPVIVNLASGLVLDRERDRRGEHMEHHERFNYEGNDNFNVVVGSVQHPEWLLLNIAAGGLKLDRDDSCHGYITTPSGAVVLEDHSSLVGGVIADSLSINDRSCLRLLKYVNQSPVVVLTSPVDGSSALALSALELKATADDSDGLVASVEFYLGSTLLGSSTGAPYQFTVGSVAPGSYSFTAKVTDNLGASTVSAPVSVTVTKIPTSVWLGALNKIYDGGAQNVATSTVPADLPLVITYNGSTELPVNAGNYDVVATIDDLNYAGSETAIMEIAQASPQILWSKPSDIVVGTALSSSQLNAVANVPGTFTYTPAAGTVLEAGDGQALSVTFTPDDTTNYTAANATNTINVLAPVPATITLDGVSSATNTAATTTLSWSHTLTADTGSNRALIVGVVARGSSLAKYGITSVTYNGVPMISLDATAVEAGSGTFNYTKQFYLLDAALPVAGTYTVLVTFVASQTTSNNPSGGAISLTNVDQVAPVGFANGTGAVNANNISTTVPATAGSWVVDTVGVGSTKANLVANNAGMVERYNIVQTGGVPNSGVAGATQVAGSSGSVTMAWKNATARVAHSLTLFSPALSIPMAPSITLQPISQTVNAGANVSFTVAAAGTSPLTYQWYKNSVAIPGATALTYALTNVQTGAAGLYSVMVSNNLGHVLSMPATLTVNLLAPVITTQPLTQTVNLGDTTTLSVVATGSAPLAYLWYKDNVPLPEATTSTLTITNAQIADGGSYHVTVGNSVTTVTSDPAIVTINTAPVAPVITKQPASQTAGVGTNVTFSVTATGTGPMMYQWQKDGMDLPLAKSASLTLSNVQFTDAGSYQVIVSNIADDVTSVPATLTVNALTSPSSLYNLTGFATLGTGTTGGGLVAESDASYRKVYTALDLAQAIKDSKTAGAVKVIEIMNDLNLGWNEIDPAVKSLSSTPFRSHNAPKLHPTLIITGVSLIDIQSKPGLTIFSANGATIRHATFNFKGTSNIIVRNLKFDEMWEWDEATKGDYDSNDWDFIDLSNGSPVINVWIDHCTFTKTYDGIMDMKAGTQYVTMSWCKYVGDDGATNANSFVRQQIAALEANQSAYPFYNFLRTNGFSVEDIVQIIQGHDKCHLMGSNSLDANNATLSATFHHQWFQDIWDRCVPRLRAGQVHSYNIFVDDSVALIAKRLRDTRAAAMSSSAQSTLSNTYSFNPFLNGSISTEGGAILVEKSIYLDCLTPLRNNQTDINNPVYTGKILSTDSIFMFHETDGTTTTQRGDSTDAGSRMGPFQAAIIPFSWNTADGNRPYPAPPMDDPANLETVLAAGAGAGKISWSKDNWLKTSY